MAQNTFSHVLHKLRMNYVGCTSVNLKGRVLDNVQLKVLASMLKKNTYLQTLILSKTNMDTRGFKIIVEALAHNKTLRILDVSENRINLNGVKYLARTPIQLTSLNMSFNNLGRDALKHFSHILQDSTTILTELRLNTCNIPNEDVEQFNPQKLKILDLTCNEVGNSGVLSMMRHTNVLEEVILKLNCIDMDCIVDLCNILSHHQTLKKFDISHNYINENGYKLMRHSTTA